MNITVVLPAALRAHAGNLAELTLTLPEKTTLEQLLRSLIKSYPALQPYLLDEDGALCGFMNFYLGTDDVRFLDGLQTVLVDGAKLNLVPALAGG